MKIRRDEFKSILKECLQEMAADGTLAQLIPQPQYQGIQQIPQTNQMAHMLAQQGKTASDAKMMESIFADTAANAMQSQMNADPMYMAQQQPYYPQMQQPQGMVHVPPAAPLMPMTPVQPQAQQNGLSRWAALALGTPIRNRPGSDTAGGGSFLPGQNIGKFG